MITTKQFNPSATSVPESSPVNPVRRGPILVALHGHASSHAAITTAQLLATRLGLEVEVVSVTAAEALYPPPTDFMHGSLGENPDEHHREAIQAAMRQALGTDPAWPVVVHHGQAAHQVAREALEKDASLIIVNFEPEGGLLRTMSGVFAAEVSRRSLCPVLAVTAPLLTLPRTIIAAVDFSPASIRAVQAAVLVADPRAVVTLVHVPMPVRVTQPHVDSTGAPLGMDSTILFDRVESEVRRYAPAGITIQHTVADGSATSAILDRARLQGADLIVAGTHGPTRLERFFVGSTAVGLLHHAPCAVLIAPVPSPMERTRLELGMADASVSDDPREWPEVLGLVLVRNRGRFVTMQVSGLLTAHADHFILRDLAYDPVDRCIEIRVTDTADGACGITRTIGHPASIVVRRAPDGRERALEVLQDRGDTQILFLDDVTQ